MKAKVDEDACIGCALCADVCPSVFTMIEEDMASAIEGPVPPEDEEACRDAAEQCPSEAILIEE